MHLRDDPQWNDFQMRMAVVTADFYLMEDDAAKALYWLEKANYHRCRIERIFEERMGSDA